MPIAIDLKYGFDKTAVDIFKKMRANQPSTPSAGSCFKNPTGFSAGYLIENVGLKGFRIGDMAYSEIHANFLTNLGDGTYDDAMKLITMAKEKVKDKFGIVLELEIIII